MAALVPVPRAAIITQVVRGLCTVPEVAGGYLFGSVLSEAFRPDSDIDLGLVVRPGADVAQVTGDVEWACRPVGGHPIHATVLTARTPIFAFGVVREGSLIYSADQDAVTDFIEVVARRYEDVGPPYRRALREIHR